MLHKGPPSTSLSALGELRLAVSQLDQEYKRRKGNKGTNLEHDAYIQVNQQIAKNTTDIHALKGVALLTLLKINGSCLKQDSTILGYKYAGGELADLLFNVLGITQQNPLNDQDYLIYLAGLYAEIRRDAATDQPAYPGLIAALYAKIPKGWGIMVPGFWGTIKALENDLVTRCSAMIKKHSKEVAEKYYASLTSDILYDQLYNLTAQYRKKGKSNLEHEIYATLIDFVNISLTIDTENSHSETKKLRLRKAVVAFVWQEVEQERIAYRYGLASPQGGWLSHGSDLLKLCRPIFGVETVSDIAKEERDTLLKELLCYLDKSTFAALEKSKQTKIDEKAFALMKERAGAFTNTIYEQLKKLALLPEVVPHDFKDKVGANVKSATELGVNALVRKGASTVVAGIATPVASSVLGYVLFGPTGMLIGFVLNTMLSPVVAAGCESAAKPVGSAIGSTVGGIVSVAIYPVQTGVNYVFSTDPAIRKKQEAFVAHNKAYFEAFKKLPPEVFPSYMQAPQKAPTQVSEEPVNLPRQLK